MSSIRSRVSAFYNDKVLSANKMQGVWCINKFYQLIDWLCQIFDLFVCMNNCLIQKIYETSVCFTFQYPTSVVPSDNDAKSEETKKPGTLPEGLILDVAVKDLLLRLLEIEPTKRLRSLRTLQTIAFYKNFDFEGVKEKKVSSKVYVI